MQKFPVALLWFLASLTMVTGAGAAQWSSLKGSYAVTPKNYLDPSDDEPKDTHFRIQLTGPSAKSLFQSMKVTETTDQCTGALRRRVGEMTCLFYKQDKRYECHFSIDVMNQRIEYGVAC